MLLLLFDPTCLHSTGVFHIEDIIERQECVKECQPLMLHKKLLKSTIGLDVFDIVDAYIEQASSALWQINDVISQISQTNSLVSGPSSSTSLKSQTMNNVDLACSIVEG